MIPYLHNAIFKVNNFLESLPSFWIMRSQRSRRRDKGLWPRCEFLLHFREDRILRLNYKTPECLLQIKTEGTDPVLFDSSRAVDDCHWWCKCQGKCQPCYSSTCHRRSLGWTATCFGRPLLRCTNHFAMLKYLHPTATCLTRPADRRMLDFIPAKAAIAMAHFKSAANTTTYFKVNKWRPFV